MFDSASGRIYQRSVLNEIIYYNRYPQQVVTLSGTCLFRMLVEHPLALARVDKNLKKEIPGSPFWLFVRIQMFYLSVGMFEGCLANIQRIGTISEVVIFWTSTINLNATRIFLH